MKFSNIVITFGNEQPYTSRWHMNYSINLYNKHTCLKIHLNSSINTQQDSVYRVKNNTTHLYTGKSVDQEKN